MVFGPQYKDTLSASNKGGTSDIESKETDVPKSLKWTRLSSRIQMHCNLAITIGRWLVVWKQIKNDNKLIIK